MEYLGSPNFKLSITKGNKNGLRRSKGTGADNGTLEIP